MPADHEFGFELQVCAWAERNWPLDDRDVVPVVGRQLGTRRRRWDTVIVEADPDALAVRANFGADALDSDLLHVVRNAPAEWAWYQDVLPDPGYPWRYVREAIHTAAARDLVDTRRDGNRIEIRRRWPYPDWAERVIAVENKPDLDRAAARDLADQMERDVALGLADEVWVATQATGADIEPILLADCPAEAGVLVVDADGETTAEVTWHPGSLAPDRPGTRILDRPNGTEFDQSAARFEYVDATEKTSTRREIAERAYGRGWRSFADTMRTDCRHFALARDDPGLVPHCGAHGRVQTDRECSGDCPRFEPEPPGWRSRGWPIEGGPGVAITRLLASRRARRRGR